MTAKFHLAKKFNKPASYPAMEYVEINVSPTHIVDRPSNADDLVRFPKEHDAFKAGQKKPLPAISPVAVEAVEAVAEQPELTAAVETPETPELPPAKE